MNSLQDLNILVTRPEKQAHLLCDLIALEGGKPIRFPVLEITQVEDTMTIKKILNELANYTWVIFVSLNAVNFALQAKNGKISGFSHTKFAAIGEATAKAMQSAGLCVDLLPETGASSEALLSMPQLQQLQGQVCLIVRGQGGHELLADSLRQRGAEVEYLEVYKRIRPESDASFIINLVNKKKLHRIVITSGEALKNLAYMLGNDMLPKLINIPLIVVSGRIQQLAQEIGFNTIVVTDKPSDNAIVEALNFGE